MPAVAMQSDGGYHAGASLFLGRCRAGGVSGSCQGRTTAPTGAGRQGEVTERELHEACERLDKTHKRVEGVRAIMKDLQLLEASLVAESERLAEIIAEHVYTRFMTADRQKAVRRERK